MASALQSYGYAVFNRSESKTAQGVCVTHLMVKDIAAALELKTQKRSKSDRKRGRKTR